MMFNDYNIYIYNGISYDVPRVYGVMALFAIADDSQQKNRIHDSRHLEDISKHELKVGTVLAIWSCRIVCMLIGISASRTVATVATVASECNARQNDQNAKLRICPMPRDSLLTKKSLHVDSAHNPFLLCLCCVSQCFTALTLSTRVNSVNCRDCSAPGIRIRHSARVHGLAF